MCCRCERVDVFGVGLLSAAWDQDKVYAHFWDDAVGQCVPSAAPLRTIAMHRPERFRQFRRWRDTRVRTDLLMHVLHAFGVLRWRR